MDGEAQMYDDGQAFAGDEDDGVSDDGSDDEPLGLRARMVRRGSEGLEVRSGMAVQRRWDEMERERLVEDYERRRGLR